MERYENESSYKIANISRSKELLSINSDNENKDVKFSLMPFLILDEKNSVATTVLKSQFFKKDNSPLSNELTLQVDYKFSDCLPIVPDGQDKVKIHNYEDLLAIFDTSIGMFRGILFDWLQDSDLQYPLPFVDIENFIKGLRVSFS